MHRINTGDSCPITAPSYRQGHILEEAIREQVEEYLKDEIIRPSKSPWRAPVVIVLKKGTGKLRMCIDYRKLNSVTAKDSYLLPNMQKVLDSLSRAKIFSKIDALSGYHQVKVAEEDIHKTAFGCKQGVFEFLRMPFGLVNALVIFQRIMDQALKEELWKFVVVYLDDVIVFSKPLDKHKKYLKIVKTKLQAIWITFNKEKCDFLKTEVAMLGHIIYKEINKSDSKRVGVIRNFKYSETNKELMSFLGLVGFRRKFIPNLFSKCKTLFKLLKKKKYQG